MVEDTNPLAISSELETELSSQYDAIFGTGEAEEASESVEETDNVVAQDEQDHPAEDAQLEEDETETVEGGEAETEESEDDAAEEDEAATDEDEQTEDQQLFTVKINGAEHQVTLEELQKGYQTARAANEKFEAAARKEKELEGLVEFVEQFDEAFQNNPQKLFSYYTELLDDPNQVIIAMIERTAALGKLHPQLVEIFGLDETYVTKAQAALERERREHAEAQLEQQKAAQTEQPDEFGYTQADYAQIATELVSAAGLDDASTDDQIAMLQAVAEIRATRNIGNPYIAFAQWREAQALKAAEAAKAEAAKATAAVKAAKSAAKPKQRIPGAAATSGQVAAAERTSTAPILDNYEAAEQAWNELFGDQ